MGITVSNLVEIPVQVQGLSCRLAGYNFEAPMFDPCLSVSSRIPAHLLANHSTATITLW